jgi:hypothetical protein
MMKQFGRTMMTVMGLAVAAAMSIHAQTTTVNHGYNASLGIFDGNTGTITFLSVDITGNGYVLSYQQFGPTSSSGSGPVPASSVNVTGSSVNAGNVTFTLNVNTCGLAGFTTTGACGPFNLTWVQMPTDVGGSTITSGTQRTTMPGMGTTIINGHTETFNAVLGGTALSEVFPSIPFGGTLEYLTNAIVTKTK